ncbi:MAG: hypothetical protein LOX97_09895 [Sphingomonas sp.]|nr:hypothetical protein [Sphingomonas sp.]
MGDADRMAHYGGVGIGILIDIYAPHELHELAGLRALVRALGIDCLANQMDRHGIISHFRCAIIPLADVMGKNYLSPHMRDNSKVHCPWTIIDLGGDFRIGIAARVQCADGVDQFERAVLATRQILDDTHDETVFFGRIDHDGGDRFRVETACRRPLPPATSNGFATLGC